MSIAATAAETADSSTAETAVQQLLTPHTPIGGRRIHCFRGGQAEARKARRILVKYIVFAKAKQRLEKLVKYM